MGIREAMNRHSNITTAVVVCVIACGVGAIAWELMGTNSSLPTKNYFTTDDGKTWFVDSAKQLPPFDHNGAQAVRCYVFQGKNGKFAGLLEKYSDSTREMLLHTTKPPANIPVMVKKPGDQVWQNSGPDEESLMILHTRSPDGSEADLVMP